MPTPDILIEGSDRQGYKAWRTDRPDLMITRATIDECEQELRTLLRQHRLKAPAMVRIETTE